MSAGSSLLDARRILAALDVRNGMHIADFGAGRTGHFAFSAGEMVGQHGRVYAVDVLPSAISVLESTRALRGAVNVFPLWGDMERAQGVPLDDATLDLVLLIHALSAMEQWKVFADEARRVVKPDGRIVVIDWHPLAEHPVMPQKAHLAASQESDMLFTASGCRKSGEFTPSRWHWGRVYSS